jgi:acyl-coenzyme A thioesterase 13
MPHDEPRPPPGFEPLFRSSPFLDTVGPFFYRKEPDGGFVLGVRILPKHANARGSAHGGLLFTLIDIALGYRAALSEKPPAPLITASVCADFVGAPKVGDWVEAHVDVQKVGGRLFRQCVPRGRRRAPGARQRRVRARRRTLAEPGHGCGHARGPRPAMTPQRWLPRTLV